MELHGELAVTVPQHGHRHSDRRVLRGRATRRALQIHLGGRLHLDRLASGLWERAEGSDRYVAPRGRLTHLAEHEHGERFVLVDRLKQLHERRLATEDTKADIAHAQFLVVLVPGVSLQRTLATSDGSGGLRHLMRGAERNKGRV